MIPPRLTGQTDDKNVFLPASLMLFNTVFSSEMGDQTFHIYTSGIRKPEQNIDDMIA